MSADELALKGPRRAAECIDYAIADLNSATRLLADLQSETTVGSELWHRLESIDDRIHNALSHLGD